MLNNHWNKIVLNNSFPVNTYVLTCLMQYGECTNVQEMKFANGLWWTKDGMYTYYSPTHYKEI